MWIKTKTITVNILVYNVPDIFYLFIKINMFKYIIMKNCTHYYLLTCFVDDEIIFEY